MCRQFSHRTGRSFPEPGNQRLLDLKNSNINSGFIMNIQQKRTMPYATDGLTDRFYQVQQWRSSFGISKMSKIGIAFLLMAPCLFAQGDEEHKDKKHEDEKHKGNSGVHHEEAKPESGPIVENYKIVEHAILHDGKKGEYIMGTAKNGAKLRQLCDDCGFG
jgi:hypothetical protein